MSYPSDITDQDWNQIKKYFKPRNKRGAIPKHDKRSIVNAILYVTRGGIQWRMLPSDFPPWQKRYTTTIAIGVCEDYGKRSWMI